MTSDAGTGGSEVVRPPWTGAVQASLGPLAVGLGLGLLQLFDVLVKHESTSARYAVFVSSVSVGGVAVSAFLLMRARWVARVEIGGDSLTATPRWGSAVTLQRVDVASSLLVAKLRTRYGTTSYLVLLDHDGRRLLALSGALWGAEALERIGAAWGMRRSVIDDAQMHSQVAALHPGALPWWAGRGWLIWTGSLLAVLGVFALITVVLGYNPLAS